MVLEVTQRPLLPRTTDVAHPAEDMPPEVAIAHTLIPWHRDDEKARYLGYLACGFSLREALQLIERSKPWLSLARHDPKFADLENRIPEIRKELAKEYVEIEFFRNFRLALEKDFRVLWQSINPHKIEMPQLDGTIKLVDEPMGRQDFEYLLKIRSQYNPQQLQILEAIVHSTGDGFNFSKWVAENPDIIQVSRTDTVTMQRSKDATKDD